MLKRVLWGGPTDQKVFAPDELTSQQDSMAPPVLVKTGGIHAGPSKLNRTGALIAFEQLELKLTSGQATALAISSEVAAVGVAVLMKMQIEKNARARVLTEIPKKGSLKI